MNDRQHPEWCTQEHGPDEAIKVCAGPGRGLTTASGGSAWAQPVQITWRNDQHTPESFISVYGHRSPAAGLQDPSFRMEVPAADADPLVSLITVLSGAGREQYRELVTGIRDAHAAITETEPEAGT
jgi:hypothetical protein